MRIEELDEFQGLTPQMVREWLESHGWVQRDYEQRCAMYVDGRSTVCWVPNDFNADTIYGREQRQTMTATMVTLALRENRTVQAMLREINPRMRKGMPSEAAINACPFWLVRDSETHEIELHLVRGGRLYSVSDCAEKLGGRVVVNHLQCIVMEWERLSPLYLKDFGDVMQYWSCDEHGNKVRWPEKDGVML